MLRWYKVLIRKTEHPTKKIICKGTLDITPNASDRKIKGYFGSTGSLKIKKVFGEISLEEIVKQVYYLSEVHVGSIKSTRLYITTGYADRISKLIHVMPYGKVCNRLLLCNLSYD